MALRIVWATSGGQISCIRVKEATVLFVCGKCFPLQNVHNVFFSWSTCFKRWTIFINHSRNLVVSGNIQRTITDPAAQCLIYSFIKQLQLSGADLRVNQLVRLRLLRNSLSVTKGPLRRIITTSVCKFYTEKTTKQNQDSLNKTAPPLSTNIFTIFFPLVKKKIGNSWIVVCRPVKVILVMSLNHPGLQWKISLNLLFTPNKQLETMQPFKPYVQSIIKFHKYLK